MPPKKRDKSKTSPESNADAAPPLAAMEVPTATEPSTDKSPETPPAANPDEVVPAKTWAPKGPTWFQTVILSDRNEGPRMRLGRDNQYQQMAIAFDEKPAEEIRHRLQGDGWKWRGAESRWTKQLDPDRRATGQQDAEKLFDELVRIERRERHVSEQVGTIRH